MNHATLTMGRKFNPNLTPLILRIAVVEMIQGG